MIEGGVLFTDHRDATRRVKVGVGDDRQPQGDVRQRPVGRRQLRIDRQPARIDEGFAARQAQKQSVAKDRHDRRLGRLAGQVMKPDGADQFVIHEHTETVAVRQAVQMVGELLLDDGVEQAVRMKRLVAQPGHRFDVLAAFAAPVFDALQKIEHVAREQGRGLRPCHRNRRRTCLTRVHKFPLVPALRGNNTGRENEQEDKIVIAVVY